MTPSTARLLISDSEHHADMLYISGIFVPDAFIAIGIGKEWHGLFSPLEVDRARKQSKFSHIELDSPWKDRAKARGRDGGLIAAAAEFLESHQLSRIEVPGDFQVAYADQLRSWGFELQVANGSLFPEREIKSETEIRHLAHAEKLTKNSMRQAVEFLGSCGIDHNDILTHPETGKRIKSRDVRAVIETWLVGHGAMPAHTIVACGREGADPHNVGHGFIKAGEPIIIDIFPRVLATGYWGDMTRTYIKGKASRELKRMYQAVKTAQSIGLEMVSEHVNAASIHAAITDHFDSHGFRTGMRRGKQVGFFHGTGHGVGLEIHEAPRVSNIRQTLLAGHVITIEPGLYYPKLGGIRLEDMVAVRRNGCDNLTRYPCHFELP